MMDLRKETILVFVLFVAVCRVSGQTCTIGNSDGREPGVNARNDQTFYLDVNNTATCTGTITNWTVCYYGRVDAGIFSYWATYAVYQRVGDESYERVSEMFRAVTTITGILDGADGLNQMMGFNCYTDFIDTDDSPLTIRAGDIIGACVFDPDDGGGIIRRQLNIVGQVIGESLLQADISDACTRNAIPSTIQQNDLQHRNSRRLHIHANIEPAPEPTTTTAVTVPVTTPDNQEPYDLVTTTQAATTSIPPMGMVVTQYHSTTTSKLSPTDISMSSDHESTSSFIPQAQESRISLTIIAAGSASGVVTICIIIALMAVISIVVCLKRRQKVFHLTSNVAYTGQCTKEDTDYYSVSQTQAVSVTNQSEMKATDDIAANLEAQQNGAGALTNNNMNIVQNVAYIVKPMAIPLSSNVAYESHMHRGAGNEDEYDYI